MRRALLVAIAALIVAGLSTAVSAKETDAIAVAYASPAAETQCAPEAPTAASPAGQTIRLAKNCSAGTTCREGCRSRYSICTSSGGHSPDSCRQVRDACIQSCNAANCN